MQTATMATFNSKPRFTSGLYAQRDINPAPEVGVSTKVFDALYKRLPHVFKVQDADTYDAANDPFYGADDMAFYPVYVYRTDVAAPKAGSRPRISYIA